MLKRIQNFVFRDGLLSKPSKARFSKEDLSTMAWHKTERRSKVEAHVSDKAM